MIAQQKEISLSGIRLPRASGGVWNQQDGQRQLATGRDSFRLGNWIGLNYLGYYGCAFWDTRGKSSRDKQL